jgi:hypothetical protein
MPVARAVLTALLLASVPLGGAELSGRVQVTQPPGPARGLGGSVIYLPGLHLAGTSTPPPAMVQRDKRFSPHVLVVSRGATVAFPNEDRVWHNVFSRSAGNAFDLGLYRDGATRSATFRSVGLVRVYCNIHADMAAYVHVVEGNAFTVTAEDGSYRISGLPPGRHEVRAWSELAGETTSSVELAEGQPAEWSPTLDGSGWRPEPHPNKHGRAYPPPDADVDRY